jgi:hypothetical protein
MNWIKDNFVRFPDLQEQMLKFMKSPEEDEWLAGLISLKKMLPFASKEINNIEAAKVFWECIDRLRNAGNETLFALGEGIRSDMEKARDICDQVFIVLIWLNFFGYYSDSLKQLTKTRSFFSDAEHGAYGIVCDGVLTRDKRFARKLEAAIRALNLETKVGSDATILLSLLLTDQAPAVDE